MKNNAQVVKGKDLRVGQHVVVAGKRKRPSVIVLTITAINYPFAVFSFECEHPTIALGPLTLPKPSTEKHKETFAMDVRRQKFYIVSDEFAEMSRRVAGAEPAWLHEKDDK